MKEIEPSKSDSASGYKSDANYMMLAVAVIALGSLLRFALAAISHPAGDSCYHLSVARFIAENGSFPFLQPFGISDRMVFSAPPLFHLAAAAVYRFFSLFSLPSAEFAVKLVSQLFGSLTLPFVFLIGRKLYNSRIAFFATLFVAFLPLHINSSVVSFVDSLAALLAAVAVYLVLSRRIFLAAVAVGLGLLAKQTLVFMLPVFFFALFKSYGGIKISLRKSVIPAAIIAIVGLPWLVRNYLLLGNPFWPFLYNILGGRIVPEGIGGSFSLGNLFSLQHPARFFLELFGAPVGSLSAASFANLPYSGILVAVWLAAAVIFFLPALLGLFNSGHKQKQLLYVWIASFLAVTVLYVMSLGIVSARFILPAAPAIGILWALGIDSILKRLTHFKIAVAAVILIIIGCVFIFSAVESAKTAIAAKSWSAYNDDFSWVKQNTPANALIAYRGQCLSYNVHRFSDYDLSKADYVWVNQNFRLEPVSIVEPDVLQKVEQDFVPVYKNNNTGTVVYKRRG